MPKAFIPSLEHMQSVPAPYDELLPNLLSTDPAGRFTSDQIYQWFFEQGVAWFLICCRSTLHCCLC